MYAFWNNKKYKIINSVEINKSSREVTYSDLTIDFAKCTMQDLPYTQQEVKIFDSDETLKFCGFVSDYKLPQLNSIKTLEKELSLSLYTPRQLATKRTVTINRTTTLVDAVEQVLEPLINDGFSIKEINLPNKNCTVMLISRTVEEIMNYFSNKYSLYWNIDELKQITINSIDYQFNKSNKKELNIKNYKQELLGFLNLTPEVENYDYANIINVKNARIFYSDTTTYNTELKNGDRIDFDNPIDISLNTAKRLAGQSYSSGLISYYDTIVITANTKNAYILTTVNSENGDVQNIQNIGKDDSSGQEFVLTMDSTFKNLATGFTYKGTDTITLQTVKSDSFLRYANMKLINWEEIEKSKGQISPTGQIEKILDVEDNWFTTEELVEYIRNLFRVNDKYTNSVTINTDKYNNLEIGDKLQINLPEYFVDGIFIITDIKETTEGTNPTQYNISARNTNLTENFIDLFRSSSDSVEQSSQIEVEYVVEYSEEKAINEIHEYRIKDYDPKHTLNFKLNA